MKKYIVTKKDGATCIMFTADENEFVQWQAQCDMAKAWGRGQREIKAESETYDQKDVIAERTETTDEVETRWVTLKSEYTIAVEDVTRAYDIETIRRKRVAEYPAISDVVDALMDKFGDNDDSKFAEVKRHRKAVKEKYPWPT